MPSIEGQRPDYLNRGAFLDALASNIDTLAAVPASRLATPRVIAVDAAWGNGKTWVAQQLVQRLSDSKTPVASIDVFRYDHHDDAFAVIAAAIYEVLEPHGENKRRFLSAAGDVLKSAAPTAVKAMLTIGASAIGLGSVADTLVDAVKDGAGSLTETGVEKLFDNYSSTEKVHRRFIQTLGSLTATIDRPLVIVIDELDRCRPSFALEVLERVKHLFDAENVVFVMFWNSVSIHESIRHTYGAGTDAESYLGKFVAFSADLSLPPARSSSLGARYETFIRGTSEAYFPSGFDAYDFRDAMRVACAVLSPSLREVERALQFAAQTGAQRSSWSIFIAYLILLKPMDETRFRRISQLDKTSASFEAKVLAPFALKESGHAVMMLYSVLLHIADRERLDDLGRQYRRSALDLSQLPEEDRQILAETNGGELVRGFELVVEHVKSLNVVKP